MVCIGGIFNQVEIDIVIISVSLALAETMLFLNHRHKIHNNHNPPRSGKDLHQMGEIVLILRILAWLRKLPFVFIFAANDDHDDSQSIKVENIACGPEKCLNLAEGGT